MICVISFMTSCADLRIYDSIDEYLEQIDHAGFGLTSLSLDDPEYFLPSQTFCTDYEYVNAGYYLQDTLSSKIPSYVILYLEYEERVYFEAKYAMFEGIEPYFDDMYLHNGYVFYKNSNYIRLSANGKNGDRFPKCFTMAGYNDNKKTLIFLGYYLFESQENIEDWGAFLEEIYGEHYDFSE